MPKSNGSESGADKSSISSNGDGALENRARSKTDDEGRRLASKNVDDTLTVDGDDVDSLRVKLAQLRGDFDSRLEQRARAIEQDVRRAIMAEWAKSDAAWKERIRNERLVRLSYERVLLNLGFAPNRIASDLVRVSRPQPLHEEPGLYGTRDLIDIESGLSRYQPASMRKGLYSYSIDEIREHVKQAADDKKDHKLPEQNIDEKMEILSKNDEYFLLKDMKGKKDLLRILSTTNA